MPHLIASFNILGMVMVRYFTNQKPKCYKEKTHDKWTGGGYE